MKRNKGMTLIIVTVWMILALALSAMAQLGTAPDATGTGPLAVRSAEYRFHTGLDPQVLTARFTELWGVVFHPVNLAPGPFPVIVFLHGNHGTCGRGMNPRIDDSTQYTTLGTCPPGYVVTPNHRGYDYLASKLASWGYFVVSINANRGITAGAGVPGDGGLNLARGRLILKHLSLLSVWNTLGFVPASMGLAPNALIGRLNLNQVGLMGHSRGGEGVRAAIQQYRDAGSHWPTTIMGGANIRAAFEIGAVDGQTSRVLNAEGTVWNQLLPMCDGDVSNLQGVRPMDRMMNISTDNPMTQKTTYTVWGTNHNYYNTEWQISDSGGCQGHAPLFTPGGSIGSPNQRRQGDFAVQAFFRGNIPSPIAGAFNPQFNRVFNTQYSLPALPSRVDRAFTYSPNSAVTMRLDDFTTGVGTPTRTPTGITFALGTVPRHDATLAGVRAGLMSWSGAGAHTYNTDFGIRNLSTFSTLEMRLSRQSSAMNPAGPTNFSVQLVNGSGALSGAVQIMNYTNAGLSGPVGGPGGLHPILQTARIRLTDFSGATLNSIRGVRLTFNGTPSGAIYVANIRVANRSGSGVPVEGEEEEFIPDDIDYMTEDTVEIPDLSATNLINSIRRVPASDVLDNEEAVEIEVLSTRDFEVRNELLILKIGELEFELSAYPEDGDLHSVIFTLTLAQFEQLTTGEEVFVQYGRGEGDDIRYFGRLDKSMLEQK